MRCAAAVLIALLGMLVVRASAVGDEAMIPDATIQLTTDSVGLVIGYSWGSGVLTYKGKNYPFTIDGLSVGDLGGAKAEAHGDVFHLTRIEDFNGTYRGSVANLTIVGGGGGTQLTNEKGVTLDLSRSTAGLKLKVGVDGVTMTLKPTP